MDKINQSQASIASKLWNREMMDFSRDIQASHQVKVRYSILSSPRSGSTLLARALYNTGLAGDLHEYLNPSAIAAYQASQNNGQVNINDYLKDIEARRTSANGYFGLKVHYFHLARLAKSKDSALQIVKNFLLSQNKLIFITRRNKIAQSVSYYIAQQSGRWTSEHERYMKNNDDFHFIFDPLALTRCLQRIIDDDESWRSVLRLSGKPYLEIIFEDFIDTYEDHIKQIFDYLEIKPTISDLSRPLTATTSKYAADIEKEFRLYLSGS